MDCHGGKEPNERVVIIDLRRDDFGHVLSRMGAASIEMFPRHDFGNDQKVR